MSVGAWNVRRSTLYILEQSTATEALNTMWCSLMSSDVAPLWRNVMHLCRTTPEPSTPLWYEFKLEKGTLCQGKRKSFWVKWSLRVESKVSNVSGNPKMFHKRQKLNWTYQAGVTRVVACGLKIHLESLNQNGWLVSTGSRKNGRGDAVGLEHMLRCMRFWRFFLCLSWQIVKTWMQHVLMNTVCHPWTGLVWWFLTPKMVDSDYAMQLSNMVLPFWERPGVWLKIVPVTTDVLHVLLMHIAESTIACSQSVELWSGYVV